MADSDSEIGPALPPSFSQVSKEVASTGRPSTASKDDNLDFYLGPALPPHLVSSQNPSGRNSGSSSSTIEQDSDDGEDSISPALPPDFGRCSSDIGAEGSSQTVSARPRTDPNSQSRVHAGPSLPPGLVRDGSTRSQGTDDDDEEYDDSYGPALPPGFSAKQDSTEKPTDSAIGPALPPGFRRGAPDDDGSADDSGRDDEAEEESSEEEVIGPMPPTERDSLRQHSAAAALEARAEAMKYKLTNKDEEVAPSRDSWMTELPKFSKNFGMGPRTFRKNARPDEQDRSGWTETPADRAKKQQERMDKAAAAMQASSSTKEKRKKTERREKKLSERDKKLVKEVARHNESVRPDSLMEMHAKDRKRKLAEGGSQEQERRPFDRETDLQVNRFDDARRKQLLKKSAHLGDKFSHSNEKMYL